MDWDSGVSGGGAITVIGGVDWLAGWLASWRTNRLTVAMRTEKEACVRFQKKDLTILHRLYNADI